MAEAARTVRHYVSDCLPERHPYDPKKGFAGERLRNAGKVFRGFLPITVDISIESLTNPIVNEEERSKAVHHLYAYSASQEMKVELIQKGVVSIIVSLLNQEPILGILEHQCFLLLRSLCIIPQGCYAVVFGGGLAAALDRATKPPNPNTEMPNLDPREAALHVIFQIAVDFCGVRWLLYPESYEEFIIPGVEYPCATTVYIGDVFKILSRVLVKEPMSTRSALYVLGSLIHMTSLQSSTEICIREAEDVLDTLSARLAAIAHDLLKGETLAKENFLFAERLCEVLWNLTLVEEGLAAMEQHEIPDLLFVLFDGCRLDVSAEALSMQRTLTGVISAIYSLLDVKLHIMQTLTGGLTRVEALLMHLDTLNRLIASAEKGDQQVNLYNANAAVKNTIMALQLAMEAKEQRIVGHAFFKELSKENAEASQQMCEQIFAKTRWGKEFGASTSVEGILS
ncbi:unnamed protein product [Phytomonas sp. Hart1]|nr:unnamed protein product [Phytomonas sp. Hart1]|eukprot:CCW67272.1 unnamed protein product [Phytomonas sp. isolate Hart1]